MINHNLFAPPASSRFYEEDNGGNASAGTGGDSDAALVDFEPAAGNANQERVEGEKPPDFGQIGKKTASATPSEPAPGAKTPEKVEKPAGEAPAKPATPAKRPARAAEQPPKAKEEPKPAPKPAQAAAAKPKSEEKPPVVAAEAKEVKIPETDDDIDALKPKPGVPTTVVNSFNEMRTRMKSERAMAREALAEAERVKAELAEAKESSGKLPKEVEEELEGLRKFNLLWQAEKSPVFKAEFEGKLKEADESVYGILSRHGLKKPILDEIRKAAEQNDGDIEAWPRLAELVSAFKNPVDQQEFLSALKGRRDVIGARNARIAELSQSREKFVEAYGKQEEQTRNDYAKGVEKASIPLAASNEWILERPIPEGADKEQAAVIEAENAEVKKRAEQFGEFARDIYTRDPEKAATIALKAVEAEVLRAQVDGLTTERDKATARVAELEKQLSKIRSAGRIAHSEAPAQEAPARQSDSGQIGGDGHSALSNWFNKR